MRIVFALSMMFIIHVICMCALVSGSIHSFYGFVVLLISGIWLSLRSNYLESLFYTVIALLYSSFLIFILYSNYDQIPT